MTLPLYVSPGHEGLAEAYPLPRLTEPLHTAGFYLALDAEGLALREGGKGAPGPLRVDLADASLLYRLRHGGGLKEAIAKAVGVKGNRFPTVLDATAGLGRDAFILAALGCPVRLYERHPVVAMLLRDGLRRAAAVAEVHEVVTRLTLLEGDSRTALGQVTPAPEVVYLDPMFPERKKSALVKKEMRYFHTLVGPDADADGLLAPALALATARVVVKRPEQAGWLAGQPPSHSVGSKKLRFDVYLIPQGRV